MDTNSNIDISMDIKVDVDTDTKDFAVIAAALHGCYLANGSHRHDSQSRRAYGGFSMALHRAIETAYEGMLNAGDIDAIVDAAFADGLGAEGLGLGLNQWNSHVGNVIAERRRWGA